MSKKEIIIDMGYERAVVFSSPEYDDAIIGVTDNGNVVYDYDAMVECLHKEENMTREEAIEFIEYNTLRALPYAPDPAPIVIHPIQQ